MRHLPDVDVNHVVVRFTPEICQKLREVQHEDDEPRQKFQSLVRDLEKLEQIDRNREEDRMKSKVVSSTFTLNQSRDKMDLGLGAEVNVEEVENFPDEREAKEKTLILEWLNTNYQRLWTE